MAKVVVQSNYDVRLRFDSPQLGADELIRHTHIHVGDFGVPPADGCDLAADVRDEL